MESKRSVLFTILSYSVIPLIAFLFTIMYPLTFIIDFCVKLFFLNRDPKVQKVDKTGNRRNSIIQNGSKAPLQTIGGDNYSSNNDKNIVDYTNSNVPNERTNRENQESANANVNSNSNGIFNQNNGNLSQNAGELNKLDVKNSENNSVNEIKSNSIGENIKNENSKLTNAKLPGFLSFALWQKSQKQKFSSSPLKVQLAFIMLLVFILCIIYMYFVYQTGTILHYLASLILKIVQKLITLLEHLIIWIKQMT